jgi:dephospho-CoA kinase
MTSRPFRLGLTGSIGMGKSTTARLFAEAGVPVWDADAAVHRLYAAGGAAVAPVAALCPSAVRDGAIDRAALKDWIATDPAALSALEAVVHPLVAADREEFAGRATAEGAALIVFDIPLLFEKGTEAQMDATLLVTAPPALQRARVLSRPGMTEAQFTTLLSRQMPDREKRARADHIIETLSLDSARASVHALIAYLGSLHA